MAGLQNVLLVEDDVMIRDLYLTTLVRNGFKVEVAGNSEEAFAKLKTFHPDVIFLDIMLPGYSGIDILKELRTNPQHGSQHAKVIMLTNLAQEDLIDKAMRLGASGYVVKADILPNDLLGIISSLNQPQTDKPSGAVAQ